MPDALCTRCGFPKVALVTPCARCGFEPLTAADGARAVMLSRAGASAAGLDAARRRLEAGDGIGYPQPTTDALTEQLRLGKEPEERLQQAEARIWQGFRWAVVLAVVLELALTAIRST